MVAKKIIKSPASDSGILLQWYLQFNPNTVIIKYSYFLAKFWYEMGFSFFFFYLGDGDFAVDLHDDTHHMERE